MNKAALFTAGRKLAPAGTSSTVYLLSVFDLEPSGLIVHAYNQTNSREYMLPISEAELAGSGFTRAPTSLAALLDTIVLQPFGEDFVLKSTHELISDVLRRPTGAEVEALIKSPIRKDAEESIHSLIVTGLVELCKTKPVGIDAVDFLGEWLLANNPNKPSIKEQYEVLDP